MLRTTTWCPIAILAALLGAAQLAVAQTDPDRPPPGVEQVLPRGAIPAVHDPQFVDAENARIPDDAWVLGVMVEGVAKAYSLNLLNHHEVINDRSGDTEFAAVW